MNQQPLEITFYTWADSCNPTQVFGIKIQKSGVEFRFNPAEAAYSIHKDSIIDDMVERLADKIDYMIPEESELKPPQWITEVQKGSQVRATAKSKIGPWVTTEDEKLIIFHGTFNDLTRHAFTQLFPELNSSRNSNNARLW
jgi:hypothetical protein